MKKTKNTGKHAAPIIAVKGTALAAERELIHLEEIVRGLLNTHSSSRMIGPRYWQARVLRLAHHYALLPVQQHRIEQLAKRIDQIELSVAQTDSTQGSASRRRCEQSLHAESGY